MNENLSIWNDFEKTDPEFTKSFKRAGGFSGTAIHPMYAIKKMTEKFGPMGKGWGIESTDTKVVEVGDEILIYSMVAVWWGESTPDGKRFKHVVGPQWGGDRIASKRKDGGTFADDEAMKKAFTDAMLKCFSYLGIGADIHMGYYDDSKYVAQAEREFSGESTMPDKGKGKKATTPTPTTQDANATLAVNGSEKHDVGMTKMPEPDREAEAQADMAVLQRGVDEAWGLVQGLLLEKHSGDIEAARKEIKKASEPWLKKVDASDKKAKLTATKIGLAYFIAELNKQKQEGWAK